MDDYIAAILMLINISFLTYLIYRQDKEYAETVKELSRARYEARKWKYLYDIEKEK